MKQKTLLRIKRLSNYKLMGGYVKRFSTLYIIMLFIVAAVELALFIREVPHVRSIPLRHYLYLGCYAFLFLIAAFSACFLLYQRKRSDNEKSITIVVHAFAVTGMLWAVAVSLVDFYGGSAFPVVFFTMFATVGGFFVLNPFLFAPTILVSIASLLIGMYCIAPDRVSSGNLINIAILSLMIAIVSYRTTAVAVSEEQQTNFLMKISTIDTLTGLKNENAYYRYLDTLDDEEPGGKEKEYAVIVMDVNGLKHTDDTYGHRFGAHLISTAGRLLPTVFKNCDIFHTGGDEFVCIVTKELPNLDAYLEEFARTLEYQTITMEGQELFLSLARGVAIHESGEKFNDTYQRADRDMYKNKPLVKEKYHILGR